MLDDACDRRIGVWAQQVGHRALKGCNPPHRMPGIRTREGVHERHFQEDVADSLAVCQHRNRVAARRESAWRQCWATVASASDESTMMR
jgi:hypothetical protein